MIAVSNTSPLNYLILIGQAHLLHLLYGRVVIPPSVLSELQAERAPEAVRSWSGQLPEWLTVQDSPSAQDDALAELHAGERDAILLARDLSADLLIIDERAGATAAERAGLRVTGLLGVLEEAARRGAVELPDALGRLAKTSFHARPALIAALLERRAQRTRNGPSSGS